MENQQNLYEPEIKSIENAKLNLRSFQYQRNLDDLNKKMCEMEQNLSFYLGKMPFLDTDRHLKILRDASAVIENDVIKLEYEILAYSKEMDCKNRELGITYNFIKHLEDRFKNGLEGPEISLWIEEDKENVKSCQTQIMQLFRDRNDSIDALCKNLSMIQKQYIHKANPGIKEEDIKIIEPENRISGYDPC